MQKTLYERRQWRNAEWCSCKSPRWNIAYGNSRFPKIPCLPV